MDQAGKWVCNVPEHQFERYKRSKIGNGVVKGDPKPTHGRTLEEMREHGWVGCYELAEPPPAAKPGEEMTMESRGA